MGLDATVYRAPHNIVTSVDRVWLRYDEATGQTWLADDAPGERIPSEVFEALHKRLGNLSRIASIRDAVERDAPGAVFVLSRVVYSGIHCGDQIEVAELPQLREELHAVQRAMRDDSRDVLQPFIAAMQDLVAAAESEQNPIVF